MILRNDLLLLLSDLERSGVNTTEMMKKLYSSSSDTPIEVLEFINKNRQLDLTSFYEHIRKSYNNKKSQLYGNIVKEIEDPNEVLITLASLNLQILLFAKKVEDRQMFLRHARSKDITVVLAKYFTDYDLTSCVRLLKIIKADLCACEVINGRR